MKALPDPGSYLQQSAKMMDAFLVMDDAARRLAKGRKGLIDKTGG